MPNFIVDGLAEIGHKLMGHPQTTIRENTIKCFATLAMRSHFSERLQALESVLIQLMALLEVEDKANYDHDDERNYVKKKPEKDDLKVLDLQKTTFAIKPSNKQNSAFMAESLLGIMLAYVKVTHPSILLPNWPMHFSIIAPYLSHPASTVRQAASLIFKVRLIFIIIFLLLLWLHISKSGCLSVHLSVHPFLTHS